MKEAKHAKKEYKIIETYSVLIFIAALFMSVGYAKISDIYATINGTVETATQQGVFITDITNISNVNADTVNSKINYFTGTMLDSEIVLGNTSDSSITYQVKIYNNSERDNIFIGVITNEADNTLYSNENIECKIEGIEEYITTIKAQSSLIFKITFKYKEGVDLSKNTLVSKINFRFKEIPTIELDKQGVLAIDDIYPDYTPQGYEFTVSNYEGSQVNTVPMTYTLETTINSPLKAKIYDESGKEVTENISIDGDGTTQITHTYTLKIVWEESDSAENIEYNSPEYANKEFDCNITLKAIPNDGKYLEYSRTKELDVDVKTAAFYFTATAKNTAISINNNKATLEMKINNSNSETEFNIFNTDYEMSILDNKNFLFNDSEDVSFRTISGGNQKQDNFNLEFTANMSDLDITESLTLKIISTSPYHKEIEIPITITLHKVTVTLNPNGGAVTPSTITVYQSRTYTDLPTPTWTGHTFNGWYSDITGGTKYTTSTIVSETGSTQTLYAHWTSHLLADCVSAGDYVNYPVNYANVAAGNYTPKSTYTGWRVLSIEGSGDNKYVRLVTAGIPLTYRHAAISTTSGSSSITNLTNSFFNISISTTSENYTFNSCGFKNSSGESITSKSGLQEIFTNKYTQTSSNVPVVRSMTKADLDKVWGSQTSNAQDVQSNDLIAIPSSTSSKYASYYLATEAQGYYLWASYDSGCVVYTYGKQGMRPVVSLKASVQTTGKTNNVWQLDL